MRISKNFFLEEFIHSRTARIHGIPNRPNKEQIENIKSLVKNLLQPLRDKVSCPIFITSGFRCRLLNRLVGGAYNSQHTRGEAADIVIYCKSLPEVFKILIEQFEYDQVIYEYGEWLHVSWSRRGNRNQALVAEHIDGRTHYRIFDGNYELLPKSEDEI